jgi:hypothetical protein
MDVRYLYQHDPKTGKFWRYTVDDAGKIIGEPEELSPEQFVQLASGSFLMELPLGRLSQSDSTVDWTEEPTPVPANRIDGTESQGTGPPPPGALGRRPVRLGGTGGPLLLLGATAERPAATRSSSSAGSSTIRLQTWRRRDAGCTSLSREPT